MVDEELPELILPLEDRDHCRGTPGARYTLVEYGDYESPHCANVEPTVEELVRELGAELCFVFRNYPQPKIHPRSVAAAEAAEAAGLQGKFWLMHDRLFQNQSDLSDGRLRKLAHDLPIDMEDFDKDLRSGDAARRVAEDIESATESGVGDTPTFFVNGRMHEGSYEFLPLLAALKQGPSRE